MESWKVTKDTVAKASMIAKKYGVAVGEFSFGKPETAGGTEKHCLTALLERADRKRLYNSKKGGWYVTAKMDNKDDLDEAAANYYFNHPDRFNRSVMCVEQLNDYAKDTASTVQDFLLWLYDIVDNKGNVNKKKFLISLNKKEPTF